MWWKAIEMLMFALNVDHRICIAYHPYALIRISCQCTLRHARICDCMCICAHLHLIRNIVPYPFMYLKGLYGFKDLCYNLSLVYYIHHLFILSPKRSKSADFTNHSDSKALLKHCQQMCFMSMNTMVCVITSLLCSSSSSLLVYLHYQNTNDDRYSI